MQLSSNIETFIVLLSNFERLKTRETKNCARGKVKNFVSKLFVFSQIFQ